LRLDRRPQGGGRGAAFITVDFDGGNIDDEVHGVVGNNIALHPFSKIWIFTLVWTSLPTFQPPTELSRFSNFGLIRLILQ
jgi:hypothetical protein